ncbi:MAG: DUF2949 domain-containing protein [Leptolyngbyaceae cyanobacterium CAN_BIN12]|nr:DUF2949 domain-containing protein [Leptolyngbyaceae cyanobacterium CAN_BIN12]
MESRTKQLVGFLQEESSIPSDKIPGIIQQCQNLNRLPVILWQQKLITMPQLDRVFKWLKSFMASAA